MSVEEEARGTDFHPHPTAVPCHTGVGADKAQEGSLDVDGESYLLQPGLAAR